MTVDVEVICAGNELLIGKVQNTNAHWLSLQATALGANVKRVTVIQDVVAEIASALNEALARQPRFIVMTGGLGPTFDDKTFQGIAAALNRKLRVDETALKMVKERMQAYFEKRGITEPVEMTPPRLKMAMFPEGTDVIANPVGTAPALHVKVGCTDAYSLPGVPGEMEAIFNQTIAPAIRQAVGCAGFFEQSLFVLEAESKLAPLIEAVMRDNPGVYIKSHPLAAEDRPRVELHLSMLSSQAGSSCEMLSHAAKQLSELIVANGGQVERQP